MKFLTSPKAILAGRIISGLAMLPFIPSFVMKFMGGPQMVEGMVHLGWQEVSVTILGIVELASVLLYLIPQTVFLGAILLTGYVGGIIAAHVRIGEPIIIPIVLGILIWGGLFLREPRLQALLPFRK